MRTPRLLVAAVWEKVHVSDCFVPLRPETCRICVNDVNLISIAFIQSERGINVYMHWTSGIQTCYLIKRIYR